MSVTREDYSVDPDQLVRTKSPRGIRTMFDAISPTYDFLNHLLSAYVDKHWREVLARNVLKSRPQRILDVCTGTGEVLFEIRRQAAKLAHSPLCIGNDFSRPMLERAAEKGKNNRSASASGPLHWFQADTLNLPFADETFDLVTVAFGIRNVQDFHAGLKELWRVTRKGGQLAVLEFSKPKWPLVRELYLGYFHYVLPLLGWLVSGTRAYFYLPRSVSVFPEAKEFEDAMKMCGWKPLVTRPLTGGLATLYIGTKELREST
jgi:demethylmenaquinone methyltransferase/2-methoxy-6-polyprenyl-1,4-benzoquinol methylase